MMASSVLRTATTQNEFQIANALKKNIRIVLGLFSILGSYVFPLHLTVVAVLGGYLVACFTSLQWLSHTPHLVGNMHFQPTDRPDPAPTSQSSDGHCCDGAEWCNRT